MESPAPHESKSQWRRWAKARRGSLNTAQLTQLSQAVSAQLRAWPPFMAAHQVLSYLAFGSELDLSALHRLDKRWYVTRTGPEGLAVCSLTAELTPHPYGYLQPTAQAPSVSPERLELVLVPGLCFDAAGYRLGYGKGYYDRLLAQLPERVLTVGVTARALLVPALPHGERDMAVKFLASEAGVRPTRTLYAV